MSDINTVCIGTQEYKHMILVEAELEQANELISNMVDVNERITDAIIELIKKETKYGEYTWYLKDTYADIISILDLCNVDWSEGKPGEEGENESS